MCSSYCYCCWYRQYTFLNLDFDRFDHCGNSRIFLEDTSIITLMLFKHTVAV